LRAGNGACPHAKRDGYKNGSLRKATAPVVQVRAKLVHAKKKPVFLFALNARVDLVGQSLWVHARDFFGFPGSTGE